MLLVTAIWMAVTIRGGFALVARASAYGDPARDRRCFRGQRLSDGAGRTQRADTVITLSVPILSPERRQLVEYHDVGAIGPGSLDDGE